MDYWEECLKEAFEDAKIVATKEQLDTVISWVEGAEENHSMATGSDCIPNPLQSAIDNANVKLAVLNSRRMCQPCHGTGLYDIRDRFIKNPESCNHCNGNGYITDSEQTVKRAIVERAKMEKGRT